jgi:uncharacterized glyoxalase superfamily protein PhnB
LDKVLQTIYLVFNEGYAASPGISLTRSDLADEAIAIIATGWFVSASDKIMHVQLNGDMILMGSYAPPGYFEKPQGFNVNLQFDDVAEAEQIFQALAENGTVKMPIQETFWAKRFGMLVDSP